MPESAKEYLPLDQETLPDTVKTKLNNIDEKDILILTEYEEYLKIEKSKKPKSTVTGDVLKRIVQDFSPEYSDPMSKIYNILKCLISDCNQYLVVTQYW